jgi:hypothetical protein
MLSSLIIYDASAQDLFARKSAFSQWESAVEKSQLVTERNTIGGYPILKVDEEMRALFSKVNYSTGVTVPLGRVYLASQKEKKFAVAIDITGNLSQAPSSDWKDEPCKREDFLWKRSLGKDFRSVNCVSINHHVNYFVKPTGEFQQMLVWFNDQGIDVPPTVIRVAFTRYAPDTRRLVYLVDINPEHYGIARDATGVWGANGWHKNSISRDQKKVDFIENLKKWAIDVQDRMDNAFEKDARAFSNLKTLTAYLQPSSDQPKNKDGINVSTTEGQLAKVKSLFEKGLITEIQYNEQVKDILNKK